MTEQKEEFIVEPFKSRKREFRSDRGKRHNYPKTRKKWTTRICQRRSKTNLHINEPTAQDNTMGRKFQGSPSMREYWRRKKREQRARQGNKK